MKKIWLAGGCFWGMEAYFMQLNGVLNTKVGYGQGTTDRPTYQQVCTGTTGYAEVCEVTYDEKILPLQKLLEHFFRIIDPTTLNRQGPDQGTQYRTGVYYAAEEDKAVISNFINKMQPHYSEPIVVEIEAVGRFFPAEDYHQRYLEKTPGGYCHINLGLVKPDERK
ncbi:Peptide methionine sulfoxide reductase MsrA [Sporomusa silvacetica DSM 10669]|uniref:Peptide methionine sulfoxide reductase MsrA n=1 Tax=Sporomusa silvacetica DSM 10669 TaxID=1123289 RepID=A0ABZ3ING4_9FIRM|nr:peptide-methionine (S)-S-oxide reductase MsrA [Sporomusa silvacetica]OZC14714.1 peptide methionine sulfoxide reductase MsrA/MsrB [Sporomusa silvacetica DSM 10669]